MIFIIFSLSPSQGFCIIWKFYGSILYFCDSAKYNAKMIKSKVNIPIQPPAPSQLLPPPPRIKSLTFCIAFKVPKKYLFKSSVECKRFCWDFLLLEVPVGIDQEWRSDVLFSFSTWLQSLSRARRDINEWCHIPTTMLKK